MRLGAWCAVFLLWASSALAGRALVDWEYGYVNVRQGPSRTAQRIGRLTRGTEVETLDEAEGWVRIRSGEVTGWVTARSLKPLPPQRVDSPLERDQTVAPPAPEPVAPASEPPPLRTETDSPSTPAEPSPSRKSAPPSGKDGGYLSEYLEGPEPEPVPRGGGWGRFFFGLGFVLILIGGTAWAVRWLWGRRQPFGRGSPGIRVLATRPLGARHGLVLVETGGLVWLLAHGPDGIRPIAEIRDPDALRRLNERYGFLESPFEAQLRRELDVESERPEEPGPSPEERLAALRRRPKPGSPG